jgi:hypothetical protein
VDHSFVSTAQILIDWPNHDRWRFDVGSFHLISVPRRGFETANPMHITLGIIVAMDTQGSMKHLMTRHSMKLKVPPHHDK